MSGDRAMGGILTELVGEVRLDDGAARPFTTSDALAARAVGERHARAMADQARAMAAECRPNPAFHIPQPFDPDAAARAAERFARDVERKRAFLADRLLGLREARRLTQAQYRAAIEIGDMLAWLSAGKQILARSQFSERLAATTGGVTIQQHMEEVERLCYGPWRREMAAIWVKRDRSRTMEDLVRAFIVQRLGLRQLADIMRMDQRRVEERLRMALGRYAEIAGWEVAANSA